MSLSTLPISYCTNVHPGRTIAEIDAGLKRYTMPMRQKFGKQVAAGLWLANSVVEQFDADANLLSQFVTRFGNQALSCYTLNAFPFGDFHSERVKENVYLPDWADDRRLQYTKRCAHILARLYPFDGSISTVPLGFKRFKHSSDFIERCCQNLISLAQWLEQFQYTTGRTIRLAIEPEPLCVLETTDETISFFNQLRDRAGSNLNVVNEHIGVCYDVCHQAVEFEDIGSSIAALARENIRINKIHISAAIRADRAARPALRNFIEPRYLHQTLARSTDGSVARWTDLDDELLNNPPSEFAGAEPWHVHFHVPIDAEMLGPLKTTRGAIVEALRAAAKLPYAPHLEVETYTWNVLPGAEKIDLVEGLARELQAADAMIEAVRAEGPSHHA